MSETRAHAGRIGLSLLVGGAAAIAATVWLLPAANADRVTACIVAAVMLAAAVVAYAVSRPATHPDSLLIYPLICCMALACLGSITTGIATNYLGLLTMGFIFVGLYAPAGSTSQLILPAAGSWLLANGVLVDAPLRALAVRMPITIGIWFCIGGLLSRHAQNTTRTAAMLRREARRDALTALPNRRALDDLLAAATAGDAVVLIDLDNFKTINDERGHAAGDQLLVNFAGVLRRSLREQDVASRFGGDEFLVFLPDTTLDAAEAVLRRIRDHWHAEYSTTTFSAGMAAVRVGRDGTDAFGEADRLLYQAKDAGRSQWARPAVRIPPPNSGLHDRLRPVTR